MGGEPHQSLSLRSFDGVLRGMGLLECRTSQSTTRSLLLRLSISHDSKVNPFQAVSTISSTVLDRLCENHYLGQALGACIPSPSAPLGHFLHHFDFPQTEVDCNAPLCSGLSFLNGRFSRLGEDSAPASFVYKGRNIPLTFLSLPSHFLPS
jgi:hypothetical protein